MAERILWFWYPVDKAPELIRVFDENSIKYDSYIGSNCSQFTVRRSGRTWNDIYDIVNSVCAVKYRFL